MKKLKYFEPRKDKLLYRRRVPVGLRSLYGKDFYYRKLNCSVGAADAEVIKAWTEAHESFEAMVRLSKSQFSEEIAEELLTEDIRSETKRVFNILLNASDRTKAVQAIREQGLLSNSGPVGVNGEESFIDLMYEYHSTINKYFGSGFGVKLQYLDSEIAEAVMQRMLPEPCLPVHDSFIVRVGQTSKLKQVMDEEFEAATGVKAGIKITLLELSDDRKRTVKELIDDELSGLSTRLNKWRRKHHWKFFADGGTASDVPQLIAGN